MALFTDMVVVRENGEGIPIVFLVEEDGFATVSALRLGLRFHLTHGSIHVEEEYFDPNSGILTHTISHVPSSIGDDTKWTLKPGRYRAYGASDVVDTASTRTGTLPWLSSGSFYSPPQTYVKVEGQSTHVVSLNSDSKGNSPEPVVSLGCTFSAFHLAPDPLLIPIVTPTVDNTFGSSASVVACLREL